MSNPKINGVNVGGVDFDIGGSSVLSFDTYADYLSARKAGNVPVGSPVFIKEGSQTIITANQVTYGNSSVEVALNEHSNAIAEINRKEGNRNILVSASSSGSTNKVYDLSNGKISDFRQFWCVLFTGSTYLDSKSIDKNLFISGAVQRVFWYDNSNLYWADFQYISDTQIRINAQWPATATLGLALIGYN